MNPNLPIQADAKPVRSPQRIDEPIGDLDVLRLRIEAQRNPESFAAVVEEHHQAVISFISIQIKASWSDAEDLAQEVFWRAYRDFSQWDPQSSQFRTWLLAIARHRCLDYARKRQRTQRHDDALRAYIQQQDMNRLAQPDSEVETQQALDSLQLCIESLPEHQKTLVQLRYDQNKPINEIADIFSKAEVAIRMRLSRLRQTLKGCIEKRLKSEALYD